MAITALLYSEIIKNVTNIWANLRLFCNFQAIWAGTHSNNLTNQSFILKLHIILAKWCFRTLIRCTFQWEPSFFRKLPFNLVWSINLVIQILCVCISPVIDLILNLNSSKLSLYWLKSLKAVTNCLEVDLKIVSNTTQDLPQLIQNCCGLSSNPTHFRFHTLRSLLDTN